MTTALAPVNSAADRDNVIVRPQTNVGIASEQARAQAEIQSALTVAAARPRNEMAAIDRILTACQRPGLAEKAEYCYSRGGTEITGPSIDLLTVVAGYWGNLMHGFRELSETPTQSTVESYAWDMETNTKKCITFNVQHKRFTKNGSYDLTDPRDRYENLANLAQRRVRKCLEDVIPPDVVEDALSQCRETMKANADVTPDAIKKLTAAFGEKQVTKEQIEKRLGRRIDSMQPAQLVSLRRIYKSIQDGMSKPGDWFEATTVDAEAPPKTAADAAKDALKKRAATQDQPPVETVERQATGESPDPELTNLATTEFAAQQNFSDVEAMKASLLRKAQTEADRTMIERLAKERADVLKKRK